MNTARNNGMTVSGRFLGAACFAAVLPQSLFSEALKDTAGNVRGVARTAVLQQLQGSKQRRGN